jgi:hypothetical protein
MYEFQNPRNLKQNFSHILRKKKFYDKTMFSLDDFFSDREKAQILPILHWF